MEENNNTKKCPFCGEEIKNTAIKCKHCGEWLNKQAELKTKLCSTCGEVISYSDIKCPYCEEINDTLCKIKFYNNWLLILITLILSFNVTQLYWIIEPRKKDKKQKETIRLYNIFNSLTNSETEKVNIKAVWTLCFLALIFAVWCTIDLFINNAISPLPALGSVVIFLVTGFLELKYTNIIENHIFSTYDVHVKCNKFLTFVFQSFYLNYFLRKYEFKVTYALKHKMQ